MSDESQYKSISTVFINRPVMTVLLAITALLFGIFAYKSMPVNDLPGVDYPVIQVNVSYPGADPSIMGANVASPLEQQFMQIPGIEIVTSRNSFGATQLILQFAMNKSIDAAATDVQSAIQRAEGNLPVDLPAPPSFTKDNPNDLPIYILSVCSKDYDSGALYDYAFTEVAQRVNMVEGVSKVDVFGSPSSVRIEVDIEKLYNLGYTTTDLKNILASSTNMTGLGNIDGPSSQVLLFPETQLEKAGDYDNLVVGFKDGSPIFLREIAKAVNSVQYDTLNMELWNRELNPGKEYATVGMAIRKTSDGNAVTTVELIREKVEELRGVLPSSILIQEFYDRSILIIENIADVKETLIIAFFLVVLVIFLFLGRVRDTMIPTLAMPFAMVMTFVFMYVFGFSINNLSLMGLTMSIGFLVDDAIVFLENTVRRMEDYGESPRLATFASAKEISFTIISMTLSLAAVFIPLVFMGGITGRVFMEFSVTIMIAVLMSGVISLTLTPMMCSRILQKRTKNFEDKTFIEKIAFRLEQSILAVYSPTLYWMLKRNVLTLAIIALCFYGTYFFAMQLPQIFFPIGDSGFIQGVFISNTKTSSKLMGEFQDDISNIIKSNEAVENYVLVSGLSAFLNQNTGLGFIVLKDKKERAPIQDVADQINAQITMMPGVIGAFAPQPTLKISTGATSTQSGKYAYALSAFDSDVLYQAAGAMMAKMGERRGTYFSNINSDMYLNNPQLTLKPFKEKAAMLGLTPNAYSDVFKDAYAKLYYYLVKTQFQQYWSIMEARGADRAFMSDIDKLQFNASSILTGGSPITTLSGDSLPNGNEAYELASMIPFLSISDTQLELKPLTINHIDNFPSVTIYFDLVDGVAIGDVMTWMNGIADEVVPSTVTKGFQGEAVSFQETMTSLVNMIFVAIFVMYVILGILYESYIHPITVLISLPIAVVGGLFSLWIFDMELSIYSAIGLFMLMGIVKKNGIMVVDFAIAQEKLGKSPTEAVHHACMDRFRPIIMTTIAALMGMVPIALGWGEADAESRIPLGVVVVGGLIFSQLITLYLTPVVYLWMDKFQSKVLDKIPFFERGKI